MKPSLLSWGRYPYNPQHSHACYWRDELPPLLGSVSSKYETTLPYGNGRSYGDSCLAASDHVINMRSIDRFIHVDWVRGIVIVEAGITLSEVLATAIPNGWFLSVTPGTQFATVGGAIANDVHGKNHHSKGTFGNHLLSFGLERSNEEFLTCSPNINPEMYAATIGGLGLTGLIHFAEIQLIPINTSHIDTHVVRFGNLTEFFALSSELDHQHEYSVAWIDCLASGSQVGRGVYIVGDHARYGELVLNDNAPLSIPFTPPLSLINNYSLRILNELYWRAHPTKLKQQRSGYESFFYPLDRILNWNRVYGPRGFQQYQCVIPDASAEMAMKELLKAIAKSGQGSFLAVLKRCGDIKSPGLLSFPLSGTSLALDFPQRSNLKELFSHLDQIVRQSGGRLYPAKDAHMSGKDFRQAYPEWERLESMRDPSLISRFWQRVTE
ncbi:FAD/FMN-dependent dehydrogenase [Pseudomonas sp. GM50]|uniref:FAD-binding oxidoreductase n=1 Tax=Pseudomonas sp. GM50 TaxID=1144332 RepID=UPI000270AFE7|nr:FAD-binding oxidoreductase [Pseudomonas sp. GM50]EJM70718.1 FAD/FMN-dependent dehydrogenase [Pseudomonas sp. GM50]